MSESFHNPDARQPALRGMTARLKGATRAALEALATADETGRARAARLTGAAPGTLSRWASPDHDDVISITAALTLEAAIGAPVFAPVFAEAAGCALAPMDSAPAGTDVSGALLGVVRESGALIGGIGAALADGTVTPAELRGLLDLMSGEITALSTTQRELSAALAEGGKATTRRKGGK
ncbi:phage regulatory CII family protein [Methylobrevis pamukkalensis]|uniref:Uncharacterized protein n=1 Tax=Methylobrevis pamukkalensis TaxID=1439726 RepID=A0A1E3GYQ4_9HYPH|nr:phage regulatory CII family protein [Methylobrevis pamukkalensis]ODN69209.1 hypothetical protein A6302_03471 [Methylobrevis pamukkalensis]